MRAHVVARAYAAGMTFRKVQNGLALNTTAVTSSSMAPSEILRLAGCTGLGVWVGTTLVLIINGESDRGQVVSYELATGATTASVLTEGHWPYNVQAYLVNLES